jgi:hypothetical protein
MVRSGGDKYCKACADFLMDTIQNGFTGAFFYTEELIKRVNFQSNLLIGFQCHENKLAIPCSVQHVPEIFIFDR